MRSVLLSLLLVLLAVPAAEDDEPTPVTGTHGVVIGVAVGVDVVDVPGWVVAPDAPVLPPRLQALAVASLVCWAAGITAGRLLAYTYSRLTVDLIG